MGIHQEIVCKCVCSIPVSLTNFIVVIGKYKPEQVYTNSFGNICLIMKIAMVKFLMILIQRDMAKTQLILLVAFGAVDGGGGGSLASCMMPHF